MRIPRPLTHAYNLLIGKKEADSNGYVWVPVEETLEPSFHLLIDKEFDPMMLVSDERQAGEMDERFSRLKALMERVLASDGPGIVGLRVVDDTVVPDLGVDDELGVLKSFSFRALEDGPFVVFFFASESRGELVGISAHHLGQAIPNDYLVAAVKEIAKRSRK